MGGVQSYLNIYIFGDIKKKENKDLIEKLFPTKDKDEKYDEILNFTVRKRKESDKEINFNICWKCFIGGFDLDSDESEKLLNHMIKYSENNKEKVYKNIILYFKDKNQKFIIDKILNKKKAFETSNKDSCEGSFIHETQLPFILILGDSKRDDTKKLRHINYLPVNGSLDDNLVLLKKKLIAIDAYYNEKGTLYRNALSDSLGSYSSLSIKVMVIGKIGSGKSTFINASFEELVARSSSSTHSETSKCTEYSLPYLLDEKKRKPRGNITLIDTPGFETKTIKIVKDEIEKYLKNAKDAKDMIHCALYFLKEGDRIESEQKEIFVLLKKLNIKYFFVITRSYMRNSSTQSSILNEYKIESNKIIRINSVQEELDSDDGDEGEENGIENKKKIKFPLKILKRFINQYLIFLPLKNIMTNY